MKKFFATFFFSILFSVTLINTTFAEIMLFVGDGCAHCVNVEKYMTENNVLGRLPVVVYEVWNHPENQAIYIQKAKESGYTGQSVPLMVDGSHYEVGDYPIIGYFSNLMDNQTVNATSKLEADATPVEPLTTITSDDSAELNEIMEKKVDAGEKSELKDPSQLYDAANGVDAVKTTDDLLKSPLFYAIAGFVIVDIIIAIYIIKKRT